MRRITVTLNNEVINKVGIVVINYNQAKYIKQALPRIPQIKNVNVKNN